MLSVAVTCTSAVPPADAGDAPVYSNISTSIDPLAGRSQSLRLLYAVAPVSGTLSCIRQIRKEINETRKKKPPSVELKGPITTHRIKKIIGTFLLEFFGFSATFSIMCPLWSGAVIS